MVQHQNELCYSYDRAIQNHIQHILLLSEEPFHHAKNHLSLKWFYIELGVLNRTVAFTKESSKMIVFGVCYYAKSSFQPIRTHFMVFFLIILNVVVKHERVSSSN